MKAQEQLYKSLGSPPSLLTCFISVAPILNPSLLFHIQEELLLLQELPPCPHSLRKGWTTQPAAGYPFDGYAFVVSPTATDNDTIKHHPQPYLFQLRMAWLWRFPRWSHPQHLQTQISIAGTATAAKAPEERHWPTRQGKVVSHRNTLPWPGPPPPSSNPTPSRPTPPSQICPANITLGSVRKCFLLLLDYMLGCSGTLCC